MLALSINDIEHVNDVSHRLIIIDDHSNNKPNH